VRAAIEPEGDARRRICGCVEEEEEESWDDWDAGRVRGRRRVEVGGLGVTLKVVLWRRRWPWRDLGSGMELSQYY
jgi:hypothetical protein